MSALSQKFADLEVAHSAMGTLQTRKLMRPFKDSDNLECPWLHWLTNRKDFDQDKQVKGLLLMQDWDTKLQSLNDATVYIERCFCDPSSIKNDPTLSNLFRRDKWHDAIMSGDWLVSNAVWGLRPLDVNGNEANMCGFLGAAAHKTSFLIWSQLVIELSRRADFQLIVAGDWATFKSFPGESDSECLQAYLRRWVKWVSSRAGKVKVPDGLRDACEKALGKVTHVRHPSTWHLSNRIESGPPG